MAYGPSPIKRDSVISQAAQEICRIIEAERLAPGDTLPPETRLSQMLGISRNSVREALRVLHGLGYVEKAAGRRVVVTAGAQGGKSMFDESVLLEAAPIANQVRSHIAQKCAELSAERMTAAELTELAGALAALEQAIARPGSGSRQGRTRCVPRAAAGERQESAAGRDVQPGAGGAALEHLARAQELLRSAPSCASPRLIARAAQARRAGRKRGGAQAFPEPRTDARIRHAVAAEAGGAGARAGAAGARGVGACTICRACHRAMRAWARRYYIRRGESLLADRAFAHPNAADVLRYARGRSR